MSRIADMLPGPVFHVELITTARRARYYAIRFAYGMLLLFFVCTTVALPHRLSDALWEGGALTISEMAATGQSIFHTFTVIQGVTVLVLTPALVAGVVADEKRRKTLQYLMTSRLNSAQIILGKLFARLLHVAVFLAIGLPVMSLTSLFGGVEPLYVVLVYAGTLSTAGFLASLAILVSTLARRPREAAAQVYILEVAWLFGPALVAQLGAMGLPWWLERLYEWIRPINEPLRWSSPAAFEGVGPLLPDPIETFLWMVGLQAALAGAFLLLAIAALRPIVRREGEGTRRPGPLSAWWRGLRLRRRPALGENPMLWKERYVARTGGAVRVTIGLVLLAAMAALVYATFQLAAPAFDELWEHGYSAQGAYVRRGAFNSYLRTVGTLLYVAWCLGVASLAASGVAGEREEDTWTSLIATPLSGDEILPAKMFGAVWGTRWFGAVLLVLWLLGLATGAVHPVGVLAVVVETAVFVWFAAALGTSFSLTARSSARAQSATIAVLLFLNGFYLFCCIPLQPRTMFVMGGVTPMIEWLSLISYFDLFELGGGNPNPSGLEAGMTCFIATAVYAVAALILTVEAFTSFDARIDRPRRRRDQPHASGKDIPFIDDDVLPQRPSL